LLRIMACHRTSNLIPILLTMALLLAIPFPNEVARAGTVWHEGPAEFAKGTMENVNAGPGGLSLNMIGGTNNWTLVNPLMAPSARLFHTIAYDNTHDEVILFGGTDGTYKCDTWAYNLNRNIWINMNPPAAPQARTSQSMAYDRINSKMVLFGGIGIIPSGFSSLNDTWTYDFAINNWTNMTPSISPQARSRSAMVYNSLYSDMILFGGSPNSNIYFNDTWEYNITTNSWMNMNPPIAPPARYGHTLVYDELRNKIILFGGWGYNGFYNDTWTYDILLNNWTKTNPQSAPLPRMDHTMIYDSSHDDLILFGGSAENAFFSDTWNYDPSSNNWTKLIPPTSPSYRRGHAMTYDDKHGEILLVGGTAWNFNPFNETWVYNLPCFCHSGIFTSAYHTDSSPFFGTLSWDANIPQNTTLRLQFRGSDTEEDLSTKEFLGANGTINSFYDMSGQQINSINNG